MDRCNHCQQELVGIDIRRERQQDGINKAKADGVRFGPKPLLTGGEKDQRASGGWADCGGDHATDEAKQGFDLPSACVRRLECAVPH
jgi:hypothetical protein